MEIPDDILIRFAEEAEGSFRWHELAHECVSCRVGFATGDVMIVHGDLRDEAAWIEHRCVDCGYERIVRTGVPPSGMGVHVERAFKRRLLSELEPPIAERIRGAFRMIWDAEQHMVALAARVEATREGGDGKPQS